MTDVITTSQIEPILDDFLGVDCPHYEELRKRCAQRIVDLYANSRAASEWRDISTAPRDGTIVDLWLTGGGRVTDQWWCEEDKTWCGLEEEMFSHWIIAPVEGPAPPQRNEVTKPNLEEPRG